jgi:hypothetical protein
VNHNYWFVRSYAYITASILSRVRQGCYRHPEATLLIALYFYRLYRHNLSQPEPHWCCALRFHDRTCVDNWRLWTMAGTVP